MAKARGALTVLVLAAGKGKRLRSKTIKLLHQVAGRWSITFWRRRWRSSRTGW